MLLDRYDLPLSTTSQVARDAYVEGCDLVLSAQPGAEAAFARALEADDRLAVAEIGRARWLAVQGLGADARRAATRARAVAGAGTARERRHVETIALAVEGQGEAALDLMRAHLDEHPRDAMVLAPATGVFGLIGFSGRRAREGELLAWLDRLAAHYGDDWWFLAAHAFAAGEAGHVEVARRRVERALALRPDNANAVHVHAHVLYESDRAADGLRFLDAWLPTYPFAGSLHCHLWWHVAVFALARHDLARAWRVYTERVAPGASWGPPINTLSDAASLLWRTELAGGPPRPEAWRAVRDFGARAFPVIGVAFVDVHRGLALAGAGDGDALGRLALDLDAAHAEGRLPAGRVVPALARAFGAFARGEWEAAAGHLEPMLDEQVRIGGSRAQRDLVEHTLLAAYLRAGRRREAEDALRRRGRHRQPPVPVAGL